MLIGLLVAVAIAPRVQALLFAQSAIDVTIYGVVAGAMVAAATAASAIPALRAARSDPNIALRSE